MKLVCKIMLLAITVFSVSSCSKSEDNGPNNDFDFEAQLEKEKVLIKEHVDEHYPNAIEDEEKRGFWYEILQEGNAESYTYRFNESINQLIYPTANVRYKVTLLDGKKVDENGTEAGAELPIYYDPYGQRPGVIQAFVIAFFPQMIGEIEIGGLTEKGLKVGSKIRFVTPSAFAYRNRTSGQIPANSPLIFEVEVLKLQDK